MGKTRKARPLQKRSYKRSYKRSTKRKGGGKINVEQTLVPTSILQYKTNYVATKSNGTQVVIDGTSIATIEPYFEGTTLDDTQKTELLDALFKRFELPDFYAVQKKVEEAITSLYRIKKPCSKRVWNACSGTCQKILSDLIEKELGSTAYMVRSLFRSVLWANKKKGDKNPISLTFSGSISGEWKKDIPSINMALENSSTTRRLIMGFGPSSAGKTHWAQTLINLFSSTPGFPQKFISIDGGIYRETSMIYQMIIRTLMRTCTVGFDNLVGSTVGVKSLFKSSNVKDAMMDFLKDQPRNLNISLYVPETLGTCGWYGADAHLGSEHCIEKYQEFINLTGDKKWIGLLIWQHDSGSNCKFSEHQRCIGCEESGTKREIQEGKKYSSGAFTHSIKKGWKHVMGNNNYPEYLPTSYLFKSTSNEGSEMDEMEGGAPGGKFCIHNTATRDHQSIIWSYTLPADPLSATLSKQENKNSYNYEYRQMVQ
jgi:hypothetical protein